MKYTRIHPWIERIGALGFSLVFVAASAAMITWMSREERERLGKTENLSSEAALESDVAPVGIPLTEGGKPAEVDASLEQIQDLLATFEEDDLPEEE